jgi:hypothetical protein
LQPSEAAVSKRTPYLEIALTVAVMAFLAVIIAGGLDQGSDEAAQVTMRAE